MWKISIKKIDLEFGPTLEQIINSVVKYSGTFLFDNREDSNNHWISVGLNPVIVIGSQKTVFGNQTLNVNPLQLIDELLQINKQQLDIPLLTGYISYDYKDQLEESGLYKNLQDSRLPLLNFTVYEYYLVKDYENHWQLYHLCFPFEYASIVCPDFIDPNIQITANPFTDVTYTNFSREKHIAGVQKIQEYIRSGDIYQANLTREIGGNTNLSVSELIYRLYKSNTIAYGVIAFVDNNWLISTSPELFFQIDNGLIMTSPIKGTAARFASEKEDFASRDQLLKNPKELAELAMIVDLLRNDLGKICRYDSVQVTNFPQLQTLKNVYHLYADIYGELQTDLFSEIIRALFPGGSITGCPKIRACQIIEEIEEQGRGAYTGSFGRIDFSGNMQFNILIRTLFAYPNGDFSYNVGGGITLKSDPVAEFEETVQKGKTILKAVGVEN